MCKGVGPSSDNFFVGNQEIATLFTVTENIVLLRLASVVCLQGWGWLRRACVCRVGSCCLDRSLAAMRPLCLPAVFLGAPSFRDCSRTTWKQIKQKRFDYLEWPLF